MSGRPLQELLTGHAPGVAVASLVGALIPYFASPARLGGVGQT